MPGDIFPRVIDFFLFKVIVKEYVNYVSMSADGLDCQSRHSKSCVVTDGSLSTEVLRVVIGYRSTRSKLFCFGFRSKGNGLTPPTGEGHRHVHLCPLLAFWDLC